MEDKEILYQILDREIDNIIGSLSPLAGVFSGTIKNSVFGYIDPYVDAFLSKSKPPKLNSEAAGAFMKSEVNDKINTFMKGFEEEKKKADNAGSKQNSKDFIV